MRPTARSLLLAAALLGVAPGVSGCRSVYYDMWESLGKEKRDLLRSELLGMVSDQEEAEEAFTDALTRMKGLTGFHGGDLETEYDRLKGAYDGAQSAAGDIDGRMGDIRQVAGDMFREWEGEIEQISTPALKESSRRRLAETRTRYAAMERSLESSRASMTPVLRVLNDHVLYLKHNLNAAAIGALGNEMGGIEREIESLRAGIQRSIREAQDFIATMQ